MSAPSTGEWILRCDGGARGNPGPAAYGYVLLDAGGREVDSGSGYLGEATNNVAEYRGLIAGLEAAVGQGAERLLVYMDSELVVRQMRGEYKVKHAGLKPLHAAAMKAASGLAGVTFRAVPREDNARADRLVNEKLDRVLGSESPR